MSNQDFLLVLEVGERAGFNDCEEVEDLLFAGVVLVNTVNVHVFIVCDSVDMTCAEIDSVNISSSLLVSRLGLVRLSDLVNEIEAPKLISLQVYKISLNELFSSDSDTGIEAFAMVSTHEQKTLNLSLSFLEGIGHVSGNNA